MTSRAPATVLVVALAVAGCGGGGETTAQPAASSPAPPTSQSQPPTPAATSSPTPSASASPLDEGGPGLPADEPTPLSKKAAAARYLELVAEVRAPSRRMNEALDRRDLKLIRARAKPAAEALREFSIGMQNETWPYDVQEYAEQVADGATDYQLISQDIARARTLEEADRLSSGYGSGRKASERLRQRLGLPAVE